MRLSSFVFVLFVISHTHSEDVQLTFYPEGNVHMSGSYIKIICRAKRAQYDVLQVEKDVDGSKVEISSNTQLSSSFKNTNRYALLPSENNGYRETHISIKDLKGEDGGQIVCWHEGLDQIRVYVKEDLKVLVPPHSVQIMQYISGDVYPVAEDGKIILRENEDHGIICRTIVAGSDDPPKVDITLDGQNVIQRFIKEEDKTRNGVLGLEQRNITVTYEFLTHQPNIEDNGKTLVCSAATQGYDAIKQQATLEVHYAPQIKCEEAQGSLGQKIQMLCRGRMFPSLKSASVSWTRDPETFAISLDDPDTERHHMQMTSEPSNASYEFMIKIDELQPEDFGKYVVDVENAHSPIRQEIELQEIVITTLEPSTPPTTTETAQRTNGSVTVDYEYVTEKEDPEYIPDPETGESTGSASETCFRFISLILPLFLCLSL